MKKRPNKKGRPATTGQPHKTAVPALHLGFQSSPGLGSGGKFLRRHCTSPAHFAHDAHTAALARLLAVLGQYPAVKVLAIHHRRGNMPLVVVECGLFSWSLGGHRTHIFGRGGERTERYEALVDGCRIGWECNPARHPRHFK